MSIETPKEPTNPNQPINPNQSGTENLPTSKPETMNNPTDASKQPEMNNPAQSQQTVVNAPGYQNPANMVALWSCVGILIGLVVAVIIVIILIYTNVLKM